MRFSNWIFMAGVALIFFVSAKSLVAEEEKVEVAPLFTLKTIKGEKYSLAQNLGKGPIVVSFWATWCGPCILEMKNMKKIYEKYAPRGVQMLSISVDDNKSQPQIQSLVHSFSFPYTILLDANKEVYKSFHVSSVPQLFILDATGKIIYNHTGYQKGDEKSVEEIISGLLGDKK